MDLTHKSKNEVGRLNLIRRMQPTNYTRRQSEFVTITFYYIKSDVIEEL